MKKILFLTLLGLAVLTLLSSCMTPRQTEAVEVLRGLLRDGVISREQFDALVAALNPATWVNDVIEMGKLLLTGGATYTAVNYRRNRARVARGEPVKVPSTDSPEAPASA